MVKLFKSLMVSFVLFSFFVIIPFGHAEELNDSDALRGVKTGKVVFDIGMGNAATLPLYLKVIGMTHDGLVKQGVKPDIVLAFHGGAVKLISRDENTPLEQHGALDEISSLVMGLLKNRVSEWKHAAWPTVCSRWTTALFFLVSKLWLIHMFL